MRNLESDVNNVNVKTNNLQQVSFTHYTKNNSFNSLWYLTIESTVNDYFDGRIFILLRFSKSWQNYK